MFKRSSQTSRLNAYEVLFFVFFLSRFLLNMLPLSRFLSNAIVGAIGVTSLIYCMVKHRDSPNSAKPILFVIVASIIMSVCALYSGNSGAEDILWIFAYTGCALLLVSGRVRSRIILIVLVLSFSFIFGALILGIDPQNFFNVSSRNGISAYMILITVLYYTLARLQGESVKLFPCLLTFIACVFGEGRSGLAVSLTIVFVVIMMFIADNGVDKNMIKKVGVLVFFIAVVFIAANTVLQDSLASFFNRFDRMGFDSSRLDIWPEYVRLVNENFLNLLFSAPLHESYYLVMYNLNLHNSFFMLHAKFGILGVLFVLLMMLSIAFKLIKMHQWGILALIVCAAVRCSFDWTSFTGIYDVLWIYLFFGLPDTLKSIESCTRKRNDSRKLDIAY